MLHTDLKQAEELLKAGCVDQAERLVDAALAQGADEAHSYYLKGKICMKRSDWSGSLENFRRSAALEPDGPAADSCTMIEEILNFYHKDMYNP